ncbi:hypothetical protein [uncultured Pseudoalteromonas sp.]|uniref:type II toxin-antitoxin system Phd/YefM family antitoxin n=1 Tax=uncultured Pseudoalteromonas sp. TaxID=114053 RepID=UPI0025969A99|nr:hypothetical protein [uncultured Pseudoalteromonas sp.]
MEINTLSSNLITSISELKKNPMAVLAASNGQAVAVLNRNKPVFYCVPVKLYEEFVKSQNV